MNPQLIELVKEALNNGTPLIRPLWMLDPFDSYCHTVKDEFSVGDQIIVAPILKANTHEREVGLIIDSFQTLCCNPSPESIHTNLY